MPKGKTIHQAEYPVFLELLKEARTAAGLTQVQLAEITDLSQSYVSAVERGVLRLDTLQLRSWLKGCGVDLGTFSSELDRRLTKAESKPSSVVPKRRK